MSGHCCSSCGCDLFFDGYPDSGLCRPCAQKDTMKRAAEAELERRLSKCTMCGVRTPNEPERDGRKTITQYGRLCDACIPLAHREINQWNREFRDSVRSKPCSHCGGNGLLLGSGSLDDQGGCEYNHCRYCGGLGTEEARINMAVYGRARR